MPAGVDTLPNMMLPPGHQVVGAVPGGCGRLDQDERQLAQAQHAFGPMIFVVQGQGPPQGSYTWMPMNGFLAQPNDMQGVQPTQLTNWLAGQQLQQDAPPSWASGQCSAAPSLAGPSRTPQQALAHAYGSTSMTSYSTHRDDEPRTCDWDDNVPRSASATPFWALPSARSEVDVNEHLLLDCKCQAIQEADDDIWSHCALVKQSRRKDAMKAKLALHSRVKAAKFMPSEDEVRTIQAVQGQQQIGERRGDATQEARGALEAGFNDTQAFQGKAERTISLRTPGSTMKSQLQALRNEDPGAVFIVRSINKLGFSSANILRRHFTQYGVVKDVHVAHSRVKSMRSFRWRLRAATLGFVVMRSPEMVATILRDGPEHVINDVFVRTQQFHPHQQPEHEHFSDEDTFDGG